ncbi:hypothetical protein [uncultured Paracoccus sp.]|uniref:hypothetical protein n=1 Tax=uncultured Paracoccus sp. TaxID=189685 RepID=UPI0025FF34CC|nr:hypothetical protein [uncultured Paracoccus sp.]
MSKSNSRPSCLNRLMAQIKKLSPGQIAQAGAALCETRLWAEVVIEIDDAAADRICLRCGDQRRVKWGRSDTGVQPWSCQGCAMRLKRAMPCASAPRPAGISARRFSKSIRKRACKGSNRS